MYLNFLAPGKYTINFSLYGGYMITKILIDKNTYDDWSAISPFAGYTTTGGFLISNIQIVHMRVMLMYPEY